MILSVTLNPSVDHALFVHEIRLGDVNRPYRVETDAGGKGVNLSRVTAELGAPSAATGFLAGSAGEYVLGVLEHQGVRAEFAWLDGETRQNFSVEDDSDAPPTSFNSPGPRVTPSAYAEFLAICERLAQEATYVAISGSIPPGVADDAVADLVHRFRAAGDGVAVDCDGEVMRHAMRARPTLIKPNQNEAERLLGRPVPENPTEAIEAAHALREMGAESVILSLGKHGAVLARAEGTWIAVPPEVETRSTIGSGDSMLGGFLAGWRQGLSDEDALRLGTACGAATATTNGTEIARSPVIAHLLPAVRSWAV